jgi:hypothetical protein
MDDKAPRRTHHGDVIRADLTLVPDPLADLGESGPAPLRPSAATSRTSAKAPKMPAFPSPAPVPAWARASGRAGRDDPLFFAGAGLALLDAACAATRPPPGRCARAWRFRAPPRPPRFCASTPTKARCATCASPSAMTPVPRQDCCACGATSPVAHLRSTPTVSPQWRRGSTWFCRTRTRSLPV